MDDRSTASPREPVLARWSRLKRESEARGAAPQPAAAPGEAGASAAAPGDADMPALETLGPDSDFACFMSPGVSQKLRGQALRKLFSLPMFAQLDGLNDYDEDYSNPLPLGDTVTYQMRQWAEREARRLAESDVPPEAATAPAAVARVPDGEAPPVEPGAAGDRA